MANENKTMAQQQNTLTPSALSDLRSAGKFVLKLDNISQQFGALHALTDINMTIPVGDRRAILGSNGAGKTTLFNVITGEYAPTTGQVHLFNEDVTQLPAFERIRMGLRRTYQISLLFAEMSVFDTVYIACCGVARGRFSFCRPKQNDAFIKMATSLLQLVHLYDEKDRTANQLSYGQQRQLEIALALAGSPRLILLDEPAAGLSAKERTDLVAILKNLPAHVSFIIIEHDMEVALKIATTVTVMHNGSIIKNGSPTDIQNDPEIQKLYLGEDTDA